MKNGNEITENDLVKMFPTQAKLHRITKKQIKAILDMKKYIFEINWGYYRGFWRGKTSINYDFLFWYSEHSYSRHPDNYMTEEETIDYIYRNRKLIENIRSRGGSWTIVDARVFVEE